MSNVPWCRSNAAPPGRAHARAGPARPGTCLEVPGEVLAAHALLGRRRARPAPSAAEHRRPLHGRPRSASLTTGGTPADVVDLGLHARSARRSGRRARARAAPAASHASRSSTRSVPRSRPGHRDRVGARPASTAPHTSDSAARGSTRRDSRPGRSVMSRPERVHDVGGEVRTGGVPAGAGQHAPRCWSQAAVIAPTRRPTWPVVEPRVAVQREDLLDARRARRRR